MAVILTSMLASARRMNGAYHGARADLAAQFFAELTPAEQGFCDQGADHWRPCTALPEVMPDGLEALWPTDPARNHSASQLPDENWSAPGVITPAQALAVQRARGCEVALNLIYDRRSDRVASFVSRGCAGGVTSNLLYHFAFAPDTVVLPIFHTHPGYINDLGFKTPSCADYGACAVLHRQLGAAAVGERVYFPDGSWSLYGLSPGGDWFLRRQPDRLTRVLPPGLCPH